jgi:multiple sugar transport system substrate-binding protein
MKKAVTRRGFIGRAAATAGALSTIATAAMPNVAQAGVSAQARLTGKLQVVQTADFHPDYNDHLKKTITDYAASQRWDLDLSDLGAFVGSTPIYDKLSAQKAAGQPVDLIVHSGLSPRLMGFYDLVADATPLVNSARQRYGQAMTGIRATHFNDGKWLGLPFHGRVDGWWLRKDKFAQVGLSIENGDFDTWDKVRESARAVSSTGMPGWGMTVNRSGDGDGLIRNVVWSWGGAMVDASGEVVTWFSPETIDAVQWLTDVYLDPNNASMLPAGVNSWNDTGNNDAWLGSQIAFTQNAGTLYATSVTRNVTIEDGVTRLADVTGVVVQPLGPGNQRLQGASGTHWWFMKGSRNFDAAAQLAEAHLAPELQRELWRVGSGYVVPAYENQWNEPIIAEHPVARVFKTIAFNEPPFQGSAYRGPLTAAAEAVDQQNVVSDMTGEILAGKPVIAAVRDAHLRMVDIYQSLGFKGR